MSAETEPDALPTFELACRVDDPETPREVTVFEPGAADVTAAWISADLDHAVPLDRVA